MKIIGTVSNELIIAPDEYIVQAIRIHKASYISGYVIGGIKTEGIGKVGLYINEGKIAIENKVEIIDSAYDVINMKQVLDMEVDKYADFKEEEYSTFDVNKPPVLPVNRYEDFHYNPKKAISFPTKDVDLRNAGYIGEIILTEIFREAELNSVNISNWLLPNILELKYLFDSSSIKNVYANGIRGAKLMELKGMFNKANIENLDMTKVVFSHLINTEKMFYNSNITNLKLEIEGLQNLRDASEMFYRAKIKNLNINEISSGVTQNPKTFASLKCDNFNINRLIINKSGKLFENAVINNINIGELKIESNGVVNLFNNCTINKVEIRNIDLYDCEIGLKLFTYSTFGDKVDLSKLNVRNVKNIGLAFGKVTAKILDCSVLKFDDLRSMPKAFANSTIEQLNLAGWDVSKCINTSDLFKNSVIEYLDLRGWNLGENANTSNIVKSANIKKINLSGANEFTKKIFKEQLKNTEIIE